MSNRIYSKKPVSKASIRLANLLTQLSCTVFAVKCVTFYALRTGMALIAATLIYSKSKNKEEANPPKDYAEPLKRNGFLGIGGKQGNGAK